LVIRKLLIMVVFLLSLVKPVYSETLSVDVYGDYNFEAKTLFVFWKDTIVTYSSFFVEMHKVTLGDSCGNTTLTLLGSKPTDYNNLRYDNLEPGYYKVIVKGVDQNNLQTVAFIQDFFITVSSTTFGLSWCTENPTTIDGTKVYITTTPTFEFTNPMAIPDYTKMMLSKSTDYFQVLNMVFVNTAGTQVSAPSGQVIIYSAIPYTPTWQGIRSN